MNYGGITKRVPAIAALSAVRGFDTERQMSGPEIRTIHRTPRALRIGARLHRVVLDDHARLPGRFFGRLTAGILAGL